MPPAEKSSRLPVSAHRRTRIGCRPPEVVAERIEQGDGLVDFDGVDFAVHIEREFLAHGPATAPESRGLGLKDRVSRLYNQVRICRPRESRSQGCHERRE